MTFSDGLAVLQHLLSNDPEEIARREMLELDSTIGISFGAAVDAIDLDISDEKCIGRRNASPRAGDRFSNAGSSCGR